MKSVKGFEQMGNSTASYGKVATVDELPKEKAFVAMIREAIDLNEKGVKVPKAPAKPKGELRIPDYFTAALKRNKAAQKQFEKFSPSAKREYVVWLVDAKTEATREKRIEQAVEWIAEGKPRNWKYMKKWA
jgi:uncharacterized protein YdeI (YjbR/CyaY-like superfamily)